MGYSQNSQEASSSEPPLPSGFQSIQDVLEMESESLKRTPMVNVIGLIKDYQPPIKTKGQDFKCSITLVDFSTQYSNGIKLIIFWPEDKMPRVTGVADVVILRNVKAQMWSGYVSLLANYVSDIHIFSAETVQSWPVESSSARSRKTFTKSGSVSLVETDYATRLLRQFDMTMLPDSKAFEEKKIQAMTVKDKYSLLKDVQADKFYDLIGEVIHVYDKASVMTMYITDYTAHSLFFNNQWGGSGNYHSSIRDGDEYGYIKSKRKVVSDWPGPYGKLSVQLSVYDEQATFIREKVKVKDWVLLQNVHIRMGNSGGCIEGFLRTDRQTFEGKIQIQIIRRSEDAERNDVRWKEAVRRKLEYWKKFDRQKKELEEDATNSNGKRELGKNEAKKPNNKKRRKEKRAATDLKVGERERNLPKNLDLNVNVKCNNPGYDPKPILEILQSKAYATRSGNGLEFPLPFINANYRSNVRVVDFSPDKLEDFSVGRRVTEYDVLSDYSGGENTDKEEDLGSLRHWKGEKSWSWRFALRVEDASKKATKDSEMMWLVIDNREGQMLLNMDAVDLRQDKNALITLREQLFKLWGDLEEKKREFMKTRAAKMPEAPPSSADTESEACISKIPAKPGDNLPLDSDDDGPPSYQPNKAALSERHPNFKSKLKPLEPGEKEKQVVSRVTDLLISNKGFACCIRQYGIKVPEKLTARANAGPGLKWRRLFGMFGTVIT